MFLKCNLSLVLKTQSAKCPIDAIVFVLALYVDDWGRACRSVIALMAL
jgi:hypothetical protein